MKLYKTKKGNLLEDKNQFWLIDLDWEELINHNNLHEHLKTLIGRTDILPEGEADALLNSQLLAPIGGKQEVWAAGVTYLRSRDARMEESKESGGGDFYQKVYDAERPELFFKALPHRVV